MRVDSLLDDRAQPQAHKTHAHLDPSQPQLRGPLTKGFWRSRRALSSRMARELLLGARRAQANPR